MPNRVIQLMTMPRQWLHLMLVLVVALPPAALCGGQVAPSVPIDGCAGVSECCCGPLDDGQADAGATEARDAQCPCALPQPIQPEPPSAPLTNTDKVLSEVLSSAPLVATLEASTPSDTLDPPASRWPAPPTRQLLCVRLL